MAKEKPEGGHPRTESTKNDAFEPPKKGEMAVLRQAKAGRVVGVG